MPEAQREYRDRLFTFIFGSEEHRDWTLSLYNAVNGSDHDDPGDVEITTIREVLYLGMHNDVSFLLADEMSLYEQQSSYNPNMPLRMLQYACSLYEKHLRSHGLNKYGKRLLALPAPRLVVFYNGRDDVPEEGELRLSDSFADGAEADIEVRVRLVNVNPGMGEALKRACRPLAEYSWTVERIRANAAAMSAAEAVGEAIESMPDGFVIRPYLQAHKAEVRDMLLTEYNEAEAMELFREEGREEGREEATAGNLASLMRTLGLTARQAMDALGIPEADRARYLTLL
jgi:hypothetical protein